MYISQIGGKVKIVNKSKLPEVIHKYLSLDMYDHNKDKNHYSATELLKSTREIVLTRRHSDEIEIDSADRIWSLFGSAVHLALEQVEIGEAQEERLSTEIDGYSISGKFDLIKDGTITDFKCTSAFTLVYKSRLLDWSKQLSIYRWLYAKTKKVILKDTGVIIAILRDWAARNVKNGYPTSPIVEVPLKLMTLDETEKMIKDKLNDIREAHEKEDKDLPPCTIEETWKGKKCDKYCDVKGFCQRGK